MNLRGGLLQKEKREERNFKFKFFLVSLSLSPFFSWHLSMLCKIEEKENINTMYRVKEKERQIKTTYIGFFGL